MKKIALILFFIHYFVGFSQQLIPATPNNADTIETTYPMFSWMNTGTGFRSTYSFVLAEIHSGQNPEEAVNINVPIVSLAAIQSNQLVYPFDAPQLKNNQWYAWQVQEFVDGRLVNKTEAWKFILYQADLFEQKKYISLNQNGSANMYFTFQKKLYFKLDESYNEQIEIELVDSEQKRVDINPTKETNSTVYASIDNQPKVGSNYYFLDASKLTENAIYFIRVKANKSSNYQLMFTVK